MWVNPGWLDRFSQRGIIPHGRRDASEWLQNWVVDCSRTLVVGREGEMSGKSTDSGRTKWWSYFAALSTDHVVASWSFPSHQRTQLLFLKLWNNEMNRIQRHEWKDRVCQQSLIVPRLRSCDVPVGPRNVGLGCNLQHWSRVEVHWC